MALNTRLTQQLRITHPIISAPMAFAAGGRLAAAVSAAGGLGLIGGGYGDVDWIDAEFRAAGNVPVGCGFITWSLKKQPQLLDHVLTRSPAAIFLSFGDPQRFVTRIKEAGVTLICQCKRAVTQSTPSTAVPTSLSRRARRPAVTASAERQ